MPNAFDFSTSPVRLPRRGRAADRSRQRRHRLLPRGRGAPRAGQPNRRTCSSSSRAMCRSSTRMRLVATYGPDDCFDGRSLVAGRASSRFVAAEEVVAYAAGQGRRQRADLAQCHVRRVAVLRPVEQARRPGAAPQPARDAGADDVAGRRGVPAAGARRRRRRPTSSRWPRRDAGAARQQRAGARRRPAGHLHQHRAAARDRRRPAACTRWPVRELATLRAGDVSRPTRRCSTRSR